MSCLDIKEKQGERTPYSAVDKPSLEHHTGNEDIISCTLTKN